MFGPFRSAARREPAAKLAALDKAQAVIEFAPDGTIVRANRTFLDAMGDTLEEARGKHHGMFVEPAYRDSDDYRRFWAALAADEYKAGPFKNSTFLLNPLGRHVKRRMCIRMVRFWRSA